jgi:uncharacterized protein YhfF
MWPRVEDQRTLELGTKGAWRDELNALVLAGTKTSTMGLVEDYQLEGEKFEYEGEILGLLGNEGELVAWIEVTRHDVLHFGQLRGEYGESVAISCGEGHADAADYRRGYAEYWRQSGRSVSDDTQVAVVWFTRATTRPPRPGAPQ